jgi:predicted acyl esterase
LGDDGTDADWVVKLIDVYPEDAEGVAPEKGRLRAREQLMS